MMPSLCAADQAQAQAPAFLRPSAWLARTGRVGFGLLALSLLIGTGASPVQANTVAKAEAECRLTDNGKVVFEGGCSIKQKDGTGTTGFVVKLEDGSTYRFSGPNRTNLRLEGGDGGSNVLFEDKGPKGVFTWNDGSRTRKLSVKTNETSASSAGDRDQINARIESDGRTCKTAILSKYGTGSKMSMADVEVTLGATLRQSIDAGKISLADIQRSGLDYNFNAHHAKGKDPIGTCATDGQGNVIKIQSNR
jgi:hypothetical protein